MVAWRQFDSSGNRQIYKAELGGGGWNVPAGLDDHLSIAGADAYDPQVALNEAGDAVVVWGQVDGGGNDQIYKAELHGGSWSSPAGLTDHLSVAGTGAHDPQVALNAAGNAVVVWQQDNGAGFFQIYKAEYR